jgi:hypothetical protein
LKRRTRKCPAFDSFQDWTSFKWNRRKWSKI